MARSVKTLAEVDGAALGALARRYAVDVAWLPAGADIPGSYWGAPEAGLVARRLFVRPDTPLHSALHELSHFVCMPPRRRISLYRDAGGDVAEECAVCYLQVLLADTLPGYSSAALLEDMDVWGYSFREGSAARWFVGDGADAHAWLLARELVTASSSPTWRLRGFG